MNIRIRNLLDRPLTEGTTTGEHAHVLPGETKSVPLELGKKWCALGFAAIELDPVADVASTPKNKTLKTPRQPAEVHLTMGASIEKEEAGNV